MEKIIYANAKGFQEKYVKPVKEGLSIEEKNGDLIKLISWENVDDIKEANHNQIKKFSQVFTGRRVFF